MIFLIIADQILLTLQIRVFHTEERLRRNISLIIDVSDGGEVVKRSKHLPFKHSTLVEKRSLVPVGKGL
jgi:hypothetical protein